MTNTNLPMVSSLDVSQSDGGVNWSPEFSLAGERGKVQGGQELGPRIAGLDSHSFLSVV